MPEFLQLLKPEVARKRLFEYLPGTSPVFERVETIHALGRVLAFSITAPEPLPAFNRSTVDGYAVKSMDTHGASKSLPAYLRVVGEVRMGMNADIVLQRGEAALIHTGGMLPEGADSVVMLEYTQVARTDEVEVLRPAAVNENTLLVGEDVSVGDVVLQKGNVLGPAQIGGLLALGLSQVEVVIKPRVGILSSGDEVVSPLEKPLAGQVRDINSYSLAAMVKSCGGTGVVYGVVPDRPEELSALLRKAMQECEMVVVTAGSSASARDFTAQVIDRMGAPGVLVHGVATKPGKPTILAVCDGKPVIGLPGNPVSALSIARLFVVPVVRYLAGADPFPAQVSIRAKLALNVASQAGREDYVPVKLIKENGGYQAEPIFFKSNLIFTLAQADGLIQIPADATGLSAGEMVDVIPLI